LCYAGASYIIKKKIDIIASIPDFVLELNALDLGCRFISSVMLTQILLDILFNWPREGILVQRVLNMLTSDVLFEKLLTQRSNDLSPVLHIKNYCLLISHQSSLRQLQFCKFPNLLEKRDQNFLLILMQLQMFYPSALAIGFCTCYLAYSKICILAL